MRSRWKRGREADFLMWMIDRSCEVRMIMHIKVGGEKTFPCLMKTNDGREETSHVSAAYLQALASAEA